MLMSRLPLPTRESLSPELQERWDRLAERGGPLNIQRAFMLNPAIEVNAFRIWRASGLEPRARELVILRAAYKKQSTYEWHQHVRIARDAGLSDDLINAVRDWEQSPLISNDERVLLAYVDALAADQRAADGPFEALAASRPADEVFGITFLITLYFQLAQVMATLELETEEPFVGWNV
jgi:4-carboxymuconolactone decarboxylase